MPKNKTMKQNTNIKHQSATLDEGEAIVTHVTPLKKEFLGKFFDLVGNVKKTCDAVGISRMTYYRWRHEDKEFEKKADLIKDAARQSMIDSAEDGLRNGVDEGNLTAIIFTLKTIGKERGYIERTETETYNMTPVDFAEQAIENERAKRASN